jgi:hypothetical protein
MSEFIEGAFSKDGHTHSDWLKRPLPDYGDYRDPMPTWRRRGLAYAHTGKFRCTEPCQISVLALEIEAR